MKEFFLYLQNFWIQLTYFEAVVFLAAMGAGMGALVKLGTAVHGMYLRRKLNQYLFPWYTWTEIQRATRYYVETKCQNVAPSKHDEPNRGYAVATKEKTLQFFLTKAFRPNTDDGQFYIILADSGMGKTTFLINLYLRYHNQFWGAPYRMKLLPLGNPDTDAALDAMSDEDKRQTILLLDAFDEDVRAIADYRSRLQELINKMRNFREVVLTCRTQFFPSEEEEPKETGVMRFGGDGGERIFWKLYLSPFDDQDIRVYLRKRFRWYQQGKKRKARQIVKACPNLMVRPMLLSYIEDLLQRDKPYRTTFEIYSELINRWIEREHRKVPTERREHYMAELYRFSREIAVEMYLHRTEHQGRMFIPAKSLAPFADKLVILLSEMEMKSRSLLNRNARGEYKFSHKSILEYFLAEEAFFNADFRKELSFEGMAQAEAFFDEMIWQQLTVPFFSRNDLNGEYRVKDGKPHVLTRLPEKVIAEITYLKLNEWKESDDVLLFRGLKKLQKLDLSETNLSDVNALQELHYVLSSEISLKFPQIPREKPFDSIKSPYRSGNLIQELEQGKTNMFYGRQETIQRLRQVLIRDDNGLVILYGQRRTGKSCLMKYIEKMKLFEPDLQVVFVDMQGLSSEQDFYDCVLRDMNKLVANSQDIIPHIYSFHDFSKCFNQLIGMTEKRILIMIDEFESATSDRFKYTHLTNADEFIQKIRSLIQYSPNVKFALAGADGLKTMINDYSNPLFNAGSPEHISFLRPQEAWELITEPLAARVNYRKEAINLIQEATFNHPYYIQCLCQRIVQVLNEKEKTIVTKIEVAQAIEEFQKAEQDMFEYVWHITTKDAHLVLAVVAQEMRIKTEGVPIDRIENVIAGNGLQLQEDILEGPIKQLLQKDLLCEGDAGLKYTIPIGLLHTWIRRHKSLKRVGREFVS